MWLGQEVWLGAGWSNYETVAYFPVWCDTCGELACTNYKVRPLTCSKCGSEDVTQPNDKANTRETATALMTWFVPSKKVGNTSTAKSKRLLPRFADLVMGPMTRDRRAKKSEELVLHRGCYRCPECQGFHLQFKNIGLYD